MKRRILVVEDDAPLARVLCDNLVYKGFDVALAGDGNAALREGQTFKPDLVLLAITKPFALDELLARIQAVLRRIHRTEEQIVLGSLKIDFKKCAAARNNERVTFSQRQFEVLRYMSDRAGQIVTREELLRHVWGFQNVPLTRSVDNLVARTATARLSMFKDNSSQLRHFHHRFRRNVQPPLIAAEPVRYTCAPGQSIEGRMYA